MKTALELLQDALKTQDPVKLYEVIEGFNELAKFLEAQKGFSDAKIKKLEEQVKRQAAMIDNLEKTLWNKK